MSAEHEHMPRRQRAEALAKLEQELAEGQARLDERRARHQQTNGELKSARALASDLSWELADLEQRLRDLEAQRDGPGDPLLDRELASMAGRRAELEERVLAQMLLVDELASRVAAEEQALAGAEHAWALRRQALAAEHDQLANQLARHT
jgi:hypothetical protein